MKKRSTRRTRNRQEDINPFTAELNPICPLLALLGAHHILHISRIRVKMHFKETGGRCRLDLSGLECGPDASSGK